MEKFSKNQIIKSLNENKLVPSQSWKRKELRRLINLEKEIVTESKNSRIRSRFNLLFNFSTMHTRSLALTLFTVTVLSVLTLAISFRSINQNQETKIQTLNAAEKNEVLRNLVEKNQQIQLQANAVNEDPANLDSSKFLSSFFGTNTYSYQKSINKTGPASCRTPVVNMGYDEYISELHSFQDNSGTGYYKSKLTNTDGKLIDYTVRNTSSGYHLDFQYRGGEYAVKDEVTPSNDPNFAPPVTPTDLVNNSSMDIEDADALIKQIFGTNSEVVKIKNPQGKVVFALVTRQKTNCEEFNLNDLISPDYFNGESYSDVASREVSPKGVQNKDEIITIHYINPETYTFDSLETYLNEISNDSLMSSIINLELKVIPADATEIAGKFEVDYNNIPTRSSIAPEELKEMTETEWTSVFTDFLNEAKAAKVKPILMKNSNEYVLTNIFSGFSYKEAIANNEIHSVNTAHLSDRKFYPVGEWGNTAHKVAVEEVKEMEKNNRAFAQQPLGPDFGYRFEMTSKSNSNITQVNLFDFFPKDSTDLDVINAFLTVPTKNSSVKDITVNLDGKEVKAKLYEYESDVSSVTETGAMNPYEESITCRNNCSAKSFFIVFEFNGYKVRLHTLNNYVNRPEELVSSDVYVNFDDSVFSEELKSVDLSNKSEYENFKKFVEEYAKTLDSE